MIATGSLNRPRARSGCSDPPNVRVGLREAAVDMAQKALPPHGVTETGAPARRDRLGHRAEQPSIPPPAQDADMSNETPITTQADRVRGSRLSAVGCTAPKSGEGQAHQGRGGPWLRHGEGHRLAGAARPGCARDEARYPAGAQPH